MALLEVSNIKKSFGKTEVLKGVSFELNKGEVLVIIGSSGSGKTTLLRCLNFLETPDDGSIVLNGDSLFSGVADKEKDLRIKRLHFGLVFQQFNLFPQHSVLKNIYLAPNLLSKTKAKTYRKTRFDELRASGKTFIKSYMESRLNSAKYLSDLIADNLVSAKNLLERVGLSDKSENYPCELSGGQQQRVAIARALALQPDILCFDEPTSALDPELTGEVLKVIRGLKGSDSTMIVVTHEMEFAKNVADKVIYMADGVIVESGTPEQVFDNPQNDKTKAFLRKSLEND